MRQHGFHQCACQHRPGKAQPTQQQDGQRQSGHGAPEVNELVLSEELMADCPDNRAEQGNTDELNPVFEPADSCMGHIAFEKWLASCQCMPEIRF